MVKFSLEIGLPSQDLFVDLLKVFPAIARSDPPVVAYGVFDDLPNQRPGIIHTAVAPERFERAKKCFLLEVRIAASMNLDDGPLQFFEYIRAPLFDFLSDLFHSGTGFSVMMQTRLIGHSDAIELLRSKIQAAARTSSSVLIQGETGTSKELVARSIHEESIRRRGRFVPIDCGALPEELVESELFGYRRGAFTTAVSDKPGLFEEANQGSLFLDEIANTSKRFQVKFLRVLQEKQVRRLGDVVDRAVDVRIIAATNCDLRAKARSGEFREDLLYRLNVFAIEVPPLRKRTSDIPVLCRHIVDALNGDSGEQKWLTPAALEKLCTYTYPGNVRELQNIIESGYYMSEAETIGPESIALPRDALAHQPVEEIFVDNFWESVAHPYTNRLITKRQVEAVIRRGLKQTGGNYRKVVELFNLPETDYKRFMDFLRRQMAIRGYGLKRRKLGRKPKSCQEVTDVSAGVGSIPSLRLEPEF